MGTTPVSEANEGLVTSLYSSTGPSVSTSHGQNHHSGGSKSEEITTESQTTVTVEALDQDGRDTSTHTPFPIPILDPSDPNLALRNQSPTFNAGQRQSLLQPAEGILIPSIIQGGGAGDPPATRTIQDQSKQNFEGAPIPRPIIVQGGGGSESNATSNASAPLSGTPRSSGSVRAHEGAPIPIPQLVQGTGSAQMWSTPRQTSYNGDSSHLGSEQQEQPLPIPVMVQGGGGWKSGLDELASLPRSPQGSFVPSTDRKLAPDPPMITNFEMQYLAFDPSRMKAFGPLYSDGGMSRPDTPPKKLDPIECIKEWLASCQDQHSNTCSSKPALSHTSGARRVDYPQWVIDVDRQCIVPGYAAPEYLALSYTWQRDAEIGKSDESLQLQCKNVDILQRPDAFREHQEKLPKVILDAMGLTAALGTRYIWVDRLCIVQDSKQKNAEIARMDQVYSNAFATIVAAASCGIYQDASETMDDFKYREYGMINWSKVGKADLPSVRTTAHYEHLYKSRWAKRAWTYQEFILSKRVIFCLDGSIFWQCENTVWDLSHLRPQDGHKVFPMMTAMPILGTPQLIPSRIGYELYVDLVCPYNGRELSYEEDGLYAFSGVLNRISAQFPDGFLFGLPRAYLDYALLWQPIHGCYTTLKYQGESPIDGWPERPSLSIRRSTLPSWAWCGWQRYIDPRSLDLTSDFDKPTATRRLESTVRWTYNWPASDNYISADVKLSHFSPAAVLEIRYQPKVVNRTGLIRARFNPVLNERPLHKMPKVVVIQNQRSEYAGLMRLTGDISCKRGQSIELISISLCRSTAGEMTSWFEEMVFQRSRYGSSPEAFRALYDQYGHWTGSKEVLRDQCIDDFRVIAVGDYEESLQLPRRPAEEEEIYFHNVLWIQRDENNVAYRVGCGRILKQAWEDNGSVTTRITLG